MASLRDLFPVPDSAAVDPNAAAQYVATGVAPPPAPVPVAPPPSPEDVAAAQGAEYARQNPFSAGLRRGMIGLENTPRALLGLAQGAFGYTDQARSNLKKAATGAAEAERFQNPDTQSLRRAYDTGNLGSYALGQLGELAPSIVSTVGSAALTGGVGGAVAGGAEREALGLAASAAEKKVAGEALTKAVARGTGIGQKVGAIGAGTVLSAPTAAANINPDAPDLQTQAQKGLAGAVGLGVLQDAIPSIALLNRYGLGGAAAEAVESRLPKSVLGRIAREGAEQGAIGAGTGAATVAADKALHNWITGSNDPVISSNSIDDYMNAIAGGAIGGAAFGAPAGLKGRDLSGLFDRTRSVADTIDKWRKSQPKGPVEVDAAGNPIPDDVTPKGPVADQVNQVFNQLDEPTQRDTFSKSFLDGTRAYNTTEEGGGTYFNGPLGKYTNADKINGLVDAMGGDKFRAWTASLLPDGVDLSDPKVGKSIDAATQAFRGGLDSLKPSQRSQLGDFVDLLPPGLQAKEGPFYSTLATINAVHENKTPLDLRPKATGEDAEVAGRSATDQAQAEGARFGEGQRTDEAAPESGSLGYVPDDQWKQAIFTGDTSRSTVPGEAQVAINRTNADGQPYQSSLNIQRVAAQVARSPEVRGNLGSGRKRVMSTLLYAATEAASRGTPIDPASIREGLRVFKGEDPLSAREAANLRDQLAALPTDKAPSVQESTGRAEPTAPFAGLRDEPRPDAVVRSADLGDGRTRTRRESLPVPEEQQALAPKGGETEAFAEGNKDQVAKAAREDNKIESGLRERAQKAGMDHDVPLDELYQQARMRDRVAERQKVRAKNEGDATAFREAAQRSKDARSVWGDIRKLADGKEGLTEKLDKIDRRQPTGPQPEGKVGEPPKGSAGEKPKTFKLSDAQAEVKAAEKTHFRSNADFDPKAAPDQIARMQEIADNARKGMKALGEKDPRYGKLDELRSDAEAVRDVLKQRLNDKGFEQKDIPLGRKGDSPEPLRDSVRRVMDSPEFARIKALVAGIRKSGVDTAREQKLLDALAKGFGVKPLTIASHDEGARGAYRPNEGTVSLRSDTAGPERASTILHEFGHHLTLEKFANADKPTRDAIIADYRKWLSENKNKPASESILSRTPAFNSLAFVEKMVDGVRSASRDELSTKQNAYLNSFHEYMADGIARAIENDKDIRKGTIDRFFSGIAHALKAVYSLLRRENPQLSDAPTSVAEWVRGLWSSGDTESTMSAPGGTSPPSQPPGGGRPAAQGSGPRGVSFSLNPRERGILEKEFTRPEAIRSILDAYGSDPNVEKALMYYGTQQEAAINYGYAAWLEGKLKLSGDNLQAVRALNDQIKSIFGFRSQQALRDTILADIQSGKVDAQGRNYSVDKQTQQELRANAPTEFHRSLQKTLQTFDKWGQDHVAPVYSKVLSSLDQRIRQTNVPALRQLAALVHLQTGEQNETHGQTMQQAIHQNRSVYLKRYDNIRSGLTPREAVKLRSALRTGREITDNPKLEAKRQQMYGLMKDVYGYMQGAGVKLGETPNYWPVSIDPNKVQNRISDFHDLMMDPRLEDQMRKTLERMNKRATDAGHQAPFDRVNTMSHADMARVFEGMAAYEPDVHIGGQSFTESGWAPGGREFRPRVSDFIYKAGHQDLIDRFEKFQSGNFDQVMVPYLNRAVRRAEFTRRFGKGQSENGEGKIDALLTKAREQGATEDDIRLAKSYVDSAMGVAGGDMPRALKSVLGAVDSLTGTSLASADSNQWRRVSSAVVAYQNLRVLGLGAFGNLIDPLGVWTRSSSAGDTWQAYKQAMGGIFKKADQSYLRGFAESMGAVEPHSITDALAYAYGGSTDNVRSLSYRINQAVFKYNGMEAITNFARLASVAVANKFLLKHAEGFNEHSARYLRELGLKPEDIREDPAHPGFVERNAQVDRAIYQFVDESVLRPTPTQRPGWHNDPHYAIAAQYKGYLYSFYNTISRRMLHEAQHGNIGGVAPLLGYVGVSMAAELAREFVQYGVAGNPNRKDWGAEDYMNLALDRAGVMGPKIDFFKSSYENAGRGSLPIGSLTGPSSQQMGDLFKTVQGRESVDSLLVNALPGQSIYKGWLNDSGNAVQHGQVQAHAGAGGSRRY